MGIGHEEEKPKKRKSRKKVVKAEELDPSATYHYESCEFKAIPDLVERMNELGEMGYRLVFLSERAHRGMPVYESIMEMRIDGTEGD